MMVMVAVWDLSWVHVRRRMGWDRTDWESRDFLGVVEGSDGAGSA